MRVSLDIGIGHMDTITDVYGDNQYSLDTVFIPDTVAAMPYKIQYISADAETKQGMKRVPLSEFTLVVAGITDGSYFSGPKEFDVVDRELFINPPGLGNGDIVINGPKEPLWLNGPSGDTTNVDAVDRYGVLYWACYRASVSREDWTRANRFWTDYQAHVASRGGAYMGPPQVLPQ